MRLGLILALSVFPLCASAQVKMGHNGVCYGANDPYYTQMRGQTFINMLECEDAGGRDRMALTTPQGHAQVERARLDRSRIPVGVDEARFAMHANDANILDAWVNTNFASTRASCRDTRDTLLARLSTVEADWTPDMCQVTFGHWRDVVNGARLTDPQAVELVHLIPLQWAESRGAQNWDIGMRQRFFTDPKNLRTTTPAGRSAFRDTLMMGKMGGLGMTSCAHASGFLDLLNDYPLTPTPQELALLNAAARSECAIPSPTQVTMTKQNEEAQKEQLWRTITVQKTAQDARQQAVQHAAAQPDYLRLADGSTRAIPVQYHEGYIGHHLRGQVDDLHVPRRQNVELSPLEQRVIQSQPQQTYSGPPREQPPIAMPAGRLPAPSQTQPYDPDGVRYTVGGLPGGPSSAEIFAREAASDNFGNIPLPPELAALENYPADTPQQRQVIIDILRANNVAVPPDLAASGTDTPNRGAIQTEPGPQSIGD